MKTFVYILFSLLLTTSNCWANEDHYTSNVNELPEQSRNFIQSYFPDAEISYIKVERNFRGGKSYDVTLTNGIDIEFDKTGKWKEIDGNRKIIPSGLIPTEIAIYLEKHFSGQKVISIEKERNETSVKLVNGLELTFDRKGKLIEIDD